jgi:mono/diheme cytochrome c family protein
MSSTHDHKVEEAGHGSEAEYQKIGSGHSSIEESGDPRQEVPEPGKGPIPLWLVLLIGLGIFWAGAYLFSFSGGFNSDVFDFEPKFGVAGGAKGPVDPKVVGKALFSANCITCHQANGQGVPGQYPPLAGSEVELGDATNHLIAIVLKGLQGPVVVAGKPFNNAMQAWEAQYTDQQFAAILTYVRSDWGNNAPPITADMVKQIRAEFKDRKDQWTWPEIEKMPPKNLTAAAPAQPGAQQKPGAATPAGQSPAPNGQPPAQPSAPAPAANGQSPAPSPAPAANGQSPAPSPTPAVNGQPPAPSPTPAVNGQPLAPSPAPEVNSQSPTPSPTPAANSQPPASSPTPAPNGEPSDQAPAQSPSPAPTATPAPAP